MVQLRHDVLGLDAAILSPPAVWEASGHLANFTDPLVDCKNCNERFRLDKLDDPAHLPELRREGLVHRGPQLQPHVQDPRRPGRGLGPRRVPAARDGAGHVHQLRQRAADQPQEAAVRHRPDRQVVPQRDHARQLRVPHPRVRADGDGVLRAARRGGRVVPVLAQRALPVVPRPRHAGRAAAPPGPRRRRAQPLLVGHRRRGVPVPVGLGRARGHRQPRRLRPRPPTPTPRARSSTTSTRPPTSATPPTSSSRRPAPPAR